jgi:hypothetical protein
LKASFVYWILPTVVCKRSNLFQTVKRFKCLEALSYSDGICIPISFGYRPKSHVLRNGRVFKGYPYDNQFSIRHEETMAAFCESVQGSAINWLDLIDNPFLCEPSDRNWRPVKGCQMVSFQTKNPNLCIFWGTLERKVLLFTYFDHLEYFTTTGYILWAFGIFW